MTAAVALLPGLFGAPMTASAQDYASAPAAEARAVCDAIARVPPAPVVADVGEAAPLVETAAPEDAAPLQADPETLAAPEMVPPPPPPPPPPRFLASVGIPLLNTPYDGRWQAVQQSGLSYECASFVLDRTSPPASREDLAEFNQRINGRVGYTEDSGPDAWAVAADTLWSGRGDCEDIAILKLQLLIAAGVPEEDTYLALVRDTLRRRDHAVAVVRLGGRSWMLDSLDDTLRDAAGAEPGYQAVMAFSGTRKWLLGAERQAIASPPLNARSWPRQMP